MLLRCLLMIITSSTSAIWALAQPDPFTVEFVGNREFSSERLKRELSKCPHSLTDRLTDNEFASRLSTCLRGTVFDIYGSRGMYIGNSTDISIEKLDGLRKVKVTVSESEPVYFGSLTIQRKTFLGTQAGDLENRFPIKPGERMNYSAGAEYFNLLRRIYDEKGFLAFDFDLERITSRGLDNRLTENLILTIREDRPFVISGIEVVRNYEGNVLRDPRLSDEAIRKALGLVEGEIYNEAKLQKGLKKLNSICWHCKFENVRQSNKYSGTWGSSRGMEVVEDYANRTARIIIEFNEPVVVSK